MPSASSGFRQIAENAGGKHIAGQILRTGTSPAPNYGEGRGAESHADFVHKLGIVLKELNETFIWLRIIEGSELLKPDLLAGIMDENKELCRIFTSSLKTAARIEKRNRKWQMVNGKWQMENEPIYTHVLNKGGRGLRSPADKL